LSAWRSERAYIHGQESLQREEELVQLVMSAIKQLEALQQPVTQQRIAKLVGMTYQGLRVYPRVEALLMRVASKHGLSKSLSYRVNVQKRLLSLTDAQEKEVAE
jgi:hypothetical protein